MPPGYGPMDDGYEGYAPQAPGLFGLGMAGMGFGTSSFAQQQQAQMGAAGLFGGGIASAMSMAPTMGLTALGMAGMVAPFAQAGLTPGPGAGLFARGAMGMGRGAFAAADMFDPTTHMMRTTMGGARAGRWLGNMMSPLAGRLAPTGASMFARRAGVGMVGRALGAVGLEGMTGMGLAGGLMGGTMGAAAPLAASMAMYEGARYAGDQIYQGATDHMQGQALMNQMQHTAAPGQSWKNQGAETGRMMRGMANDLGTGTEDIGRYAKELDSQKMFQTTRSAKEFRDKFTEVMKAVKEIAKLSQGTVDDAMKTFTDLRNQGFYTTADIKAQAASREAREASTGISAGVYSAIGGAGAQMARQSGLRGRFGADLAERNVAGVAMGVRNGSMSEEEVMERGGAEAVGLQMAQKQMGFLKSSRGRAMIAYAMGDGGAPDPARLNRLMRGTSMEDIVTGAAGRGLGVLSAAGGREAQENFMPYAGMAMVQMAASQQKQLYGGVSQKGILGMMGTMGLDREEAKLMLAQTMGMPEQMKKERQAAEEAQTRAAFEKRYASSGLTARAGAYVDREYGEGLRAMGSQVQDAASNAYTNSMQKLFGGREYRGGDSDAGKAYLADLAKSGKSLDMGSGNALGGRSENGSWFGVSTSGDVIADQYGDYLEKGSGTDKRTQRGLANGSVKDLGGGRLIRADRLAAADRAAREGQATGLSDEQMSKLKYSVGRGDYLERLEAAKDSQGLNLVTGLGRQIIGSSAANWLASSLRIGSDDSQFGTYNAAVEAGITTGSYEEYKKLSPEERTKIENQVAVGMEEAAKEGGGSKQRILGSVKKKADLGAGAIRDLQAERDSYENAMDAYLHGAAAADDKLGPDRLLAGLGFLAGGLVGTGKKKLKDELSQNGAARKAHAEYMRAVGDVADHENKTPEEMARILKARTALKGVLGEGAAFDAAIETEGAAERSKDYAKNLQGYWGEDGEMSQLQSRRAAVEVEGDMRGRLESRLGKMDIDSIGDESLRANISALKEGNTTAEERRAASHNLLKGALLTTDKSGAVSDLEREVIGDALGGGAAYALDLGGKILNNGLSPQEIKELDAAGIDFKAIRAEKDKGKQAEMITAALEQSGLLDPESSDGLQGVEGTQTEYVEANTKFVAAVSAFVAQLKANGVAVEGDSTLPTGENTSVPPKTKSYGG